MISRSKQAVAGSGVPSEAAGNCSGAYGGSSGAKIPRDYDTTVHKDVVGYNPARFRAGLKTILRIVSEKGVVLGWMQTH